MIRKIVKGEEDLCVLLIKNAFSTVAKEMGLTKQNCPSHRSFLTRDQFDNMVKNGNIFYLYEFDGEAIGCFSLKVDDSGNYALNNLAILPDYRHNGYGKMIVDFVILESKKRGTGKVSIDIVDENERLKNWYIKMGFVVTGKKQFEGFPFTTCFMEYKI